MATIYLSSTYEDLKEYRRVVFDALRRSGHQVIAMEDYVAADQRPVDKCLKDVGDANIYVGVFAFRYGYVPPEAHGNSDRLSITELEFREAERFKKPCLTFVVDESKAWPPMFDDARKAEDKGERINRLRQYLLTEKMASSFSEPHELAALVLAAVTKHLEDNKKPQAPVAKESASRALPTWDIGKNGSPYPGLMHFTRKYAPVFFGREAEVREILDRMCLPQGRFIIVSGDSGVGKSSVVDAGILPKLEDGALPDNDSCVSVRMVPGQSSQPFDSLMTVLGERATRAGLQPETIVKELKQSPDALIRLLPKIIAGGSDGKTLVLFLDQMEELFTAQDVNQSNKFLAALYRAAQEKALWVIATIRSDHLQFCHRHPDLLQVLRGEGHYPLGRVEPFMIHDMIIKPANCAGLRVSDNLARHVVNDTGSESANLPLLAFVLEQLFEKKADHELSENVYKTLGGVSGAIAVHVKTVEEKMRQELGGKAAELLPMIFQSLVIVNPEGLPTRRRPLLASFSEAQKSVIKLLTDKRLLQTEGEDEASTVSISHEKLFEAWPALRDYVSVNKKSLMDQTLLENRARKWQEMGKPWFNGLASGRELQDFRQAGIPTRLAKEYIGASRRAVLIRIGIIVLPLALLVGLGTWMWNEKLTVQYAASIARARLHLMDVLDPEKDMVKISGGKLQRSDGQNESRVTIKPFKVSRYEVTFEQYDKFVESTGFRRPDDGGFGRDKHPVINVSWEEATEYAKWLSLATGKSYRLPTEAEWEYAARSGGKDEIWAGTSDVSELAEYAVFGSQGTARVGTKKSNGLSLFDMSGNVSELLEDCWHDNYNGAPADGTAWGKENGGDCDRRVVRGGSWAGGQPGYLEASTRQWYDPIDRYSGRIGFRLAQDIP